jgi:hypothetical protein
VPPRTRSSRAPAPEDDEGDAAFQPRQSSDNASSGGYLSEFSSVVEPKPRTRKRLSGKAKKASVPKKKVRWPHAKDQAPPTTSIAQKDAAPDAQVYGPLPNTTSPATRNVNKWLKVRDKITITKKVTPTQVKVQSLTGLGDMHVMPN